MTTDAPSSKPWFKKKRFIIPIVLVALSAIGSVTGGSEDSSTTSENSSAEVKRSYPVKYLRHAVINPA